MTLTDDTRAIAMLREIAGIWERAEDACDRGGSVEKHIAAQVAEYTNNDDATGEEVLLFDFVEKIGREAYRILREIDCGNTNAQ